MNMGHNGKRYLNSSLYEQNRKHMSETMSEAQSGEKNSAYGTMWIHHIETNENKKHDKNKAIPENYIAGRYIKSKDKYKMDCLNCGKRISTNKENKKYCSRDCVKEHKANIMKNLYLEIKDQVIKLSNLNYGIYKIADIIDRDDVNHMTIHRVKKLIEKGSL
jgi:adenine-specific DNA methylase